MFSGKALVIQRIKCIKKKWTKKQKKKANYLYDQWSVLCVFVCGILIKKLRATRSQNIWILFIIQSLQKWGKKKQRNVLFCFWALLSTIKLKLILCFQFYSVMFLLFFRFIFFTHFILFRFFFSRDFASCRCPWNSQNKNNLNECINYYQRNYVRWSNF